jgi:archaellin
MNGSASTGVLSLLLLSIMLMGTAAVSNELFLGNDGEKIYDIDNYEEIINDSLDEVSTYFNIKHILGKYNNDENKHHIGKAVILLKPYFDINFDMSGLHILLSNGEKTLMLQKNDKTELVGSYDVFEHPSWDYISYGFYSVLVVSDQDNSIKEFNVVNENTDMVYVTLTFSDYFNVEKGDEIKVSLIPSCGNSQTFMLKAPLPTSTIVDLY